MEITLLALALGLVVGLLVADLVQRRSDRADMRQSAENFKDAQAKLAELHNQALKDFNGLNDKVMAHEMAFKAKLLR